MFPPAAAWRQVRETDFNFMRIINFNFEMWNIQMLRRSEDSGSFSPGLCCSLPQSNLSLPPPWSPVVSEPEPGIPNSLMFGTLYFTLLYFHPGPSSASQQNLCRRFNEYTPNKNEHFVLSKFIWRALFLLLSILLYNYIFPTLKLSIASVSNKESEVFYFKLHLY